MPEMLDIYDDAMMHLGSKPRSDVHRDGDWHRVFHGWVIYRDDAGADWIILQKRAANKLIFPNYLDVSAAGHYAAGESTVDGVRELEEELGLTVAFEDLIYVGQRVSMSQYNGLIDREVANVYFYVHQQPLKSYAYQREELAGLIAINLDDGMALCSGVADHIIAPATGFETDTITITRKDMIPTLDRYFFKTMLLARRCLNGEPYLLI